MIFKQIKYRGDNFSYVIADATTSEAAVVDPSFNANEIIRFLKEQNLNAHYVINTHGHSDHIAGNKDIQELFRAKVVAHRLSHVPKDIAVDDGDILQIGEIAVKTIHTPGHTPDSICLIVNGKLITGDTLFVGECGRTDLSGGSSVEMYHSLFDKLMTLEGHIEVYPGHDYGPQPHSTIAVQRRTNYTLKKRSLEEFIEFMKQP